VRHRLYYHIVWTTRDRAQLVDDGLATFLCRFLRSVARQERAHILEIGMVSTHLHILIRTHPTTDIPRLLQRMKGGSSAVAGKEHHSNTNRVLKWSKGYSITTIGPRSLEGLREYLRSQPTRHPSEQIPGWKGDAAEYEIAGQEQWVGSDRTTFPR
jgi:REP element-mobilizing transposase RayT